MPSSYTVSGRFTLQATGENNNTWGVILNVQTLQLIDSAIMGWLTTALTGDYVLTTALGAPDEARNAMLKFTGTGGFTVTVPAVSKRYDVWNACSGVLTITNGSASVTVQPGEKVGVITDGGAEMQRITPTDFGGAKLTNVSGVSGLVDPTNPADAASKKYVDAQAWQGSSGQLPGQGGQAGKLLTTDGTTPSWSSTLPYLNLAKPADGTELLVTGQTAGLQVWTDAAGVHVEGISASGAPPYQPLILRGSTVLVSDSSGQTTQAASLALAVAMAVSL